MDEFVADQHANVHTVDKAYKGVAIAWSIPVPDGTPVVHLDAFNNDGTKGITTVCMTPGEAVLLATGLMNAAARVTVATALSVEAEIAAETGFYGE